MSEFKKRIRMIKKTSCKECHIEFVFNATKKTPLMKFCSQKCMGSSYKKRAIQTIQEVYYKKCIKQDGCWAWNGNHDSDGYSTLYFNKKTLKGHRVSWIIHNGEIPGRLFVLHKCDTPPCTNPDHLFLGTPKDNWDDMIKKGRGCYKGSLASNAKLKEEEVIEIKKLLKTKMKRIEIAQKFNVTLSAIKNIRQGKTWSHIKEPNE